MQVRTYLAIASWAVLAIALAQHGMTPLRARPLPPAAKRIGELQSGFQKAMDDLRLIKMETIHAKDDKGRPVTLMRPAGFGFRRLMTVMIKHNGVTRDTGMPFNMAVKEGQIQYYAFSNLGKPLNPSALLIHKDVGPFTSHLKPAEVDALLEFARKAVTKSAYSHPDKRTGVVLGDFVEALPLIASKPECLPCHSASKIGDALGVIVYRVKKK